MNIIDNKKDYYDYLVGVYGKDSHVVYDRRGSVVLRKDKPSFGREILWDSIDDFLFNTFPHPKDTPKHIHEKPRYWKWRKNPYISYDEAYGEYKFCMLEIGLKQYYIRVNRYLDEKGNIKFEPYMCEIKNIKKEEKKSEQVVCLMEVSANLWQGDKWTFPKLAASIYKGHELIFNETWVTKLIEPDEIYNEIYNYLLSIEEPNIVDKRTDAEKATSHGFNKESFRNPIRVKDLN